jgi:hypothetical protein
LEALTPSTIFLSQAYSLSQPSAELVQRHPKTPDNGGLQQHPHDAVSRSFDPSVIRRSPKPSVVPMPPIAKPVSPRVDPRHRLLIVERWWRARCKPPNATVIPIRRSHRVVNINDEPSATKHLPLTEAAFVLPISSSASALWTFDLRHWSLELVARVLKPPSKAACRRFLYETVNTLSKRVGSATYPGRPLTPSNATPPLSLMFFVSAALALRYSLWMPCGVHLLIAVLGQRI